MNCDWEEASLPDHRGWRRVRCRQCGLVTNPTPHPYDKIYSQCGGGDATWPGNELAALLTMAGIKSAGCSSCASLRTRMNIWGAAGCREHRAEIVGELRAAYEQRSFYELASTAIAFIRNGVLLSPFDPIGSLVDEAIRRAEHR